MQLQAPLSPLELGTRHHPGLLWPTPLGLVLQRLTGVGPHGVQLHALLNPVDSTTEVDLHGVRLHWSSPTQPLVRAQTSLLCSRTALTVAHPNRRWWGAPVTLCSCSAWRWHRWTRASRRACSLAAWPAHACGMASWCVLLDAGWLCRSWL